MQKMTQYRLVWSAVFCCASFATTLAVADEKSRGKNPVSSQGLGASTVFDHSLEVELTWMDRFSRGPGKSAASSLAASRSSDEILPLADLPERRTTTGGRTLGLTKARAELEWSTDPSASLSLVLRPDATLLPRKEGEPKAREFDSRAGVVRQPRSTVDFLDAWKIEFKPGVHLSFGLGVWEELLHAQDARPQLMGFGGTLSGPEKFSGARMHWFRDSSLAFSAWILQGREDRGMTWGASDESWDIGPQSEDPWLGSALALDWSPVEASRLGAVAAHLSEQLVAGKVRSTWLQIFAHRNFERLSVFTRPAFALDARWSRDDLETEVGGKLPLSHWNVGLSTRLGVVADWSISMGLHQGVGEDMNEADWTRSLKTEGSQYDFGLIWQFAPSLSASGMVAHEVRRAETPDGKMVGAFGDGDRKTDNIRRVLFEIRYANRD